MTDDEIFAWLAMLGRGRAAQRAAVFELLAHANTDKMYRADRLICKRALELTEPAQKVA